MAAGPRTGTVRQRQYALKPGKSILEKLWDDVTGISWKLATEGDALKKGERNRLQGKAEGIAWAIGRMLTTYEDPDKTMAVIRECVGLWLEARETGNYPLAETVPWRHTAFTRPGTRAGYGEEKGSNDAD